MEELQFSTVPTEIALEASTTQPMTEAVAPPASHLRLLKSAARHRVRGCCCLCVGWMTAEALPAGTLVPVDRGLKPQGSAPFLIVARQWRGGLGPATLVVPANLVGALPVLWIARLAQHGDYLQDVLAVVLLTVVAGFLQTVHEHTCTMRVATCGVTPAVTHRTDCNILRHIRSP